MDKLVLGAARADQQPLVHAAERIDDVVEIVPVELLVSRADDARLVVDLAERAVGLDALVLDVLRVEAKNVSFLRIHPDDGVTVRHVKTLPMFR